jgi:hypothetical protein
MKNLLNENKAKTTTLTHGVLMKKLLTGLLTLASLSGFAECEIFEFSHGNYKVPDVEICADVKEVHNGIELSNFSENIHATAHKNDPVGQLFISVFSEKRVPLFVCEQFLKASVSDIALTTTNRSNDQITVVGKFAGYIWVKPDQQTNIRLNTIKKIISGPWLKKEDSVNF